MEDFVSVEKIKGLFESSKYINLSTIRDDGTPHPSNVRVAHGHSLSMYFLSESTSQKSKNIGIDQRVSGSLLIEPPKPGTGVNLYFNGIAHRLSPDEDIPSLLPGYTKERENAVRALCSGRADYADKIHDILNGKTDLILHRILLTQAWYNGGIYSEDDEVEVNATRSLRIVGDKACPLVRRYLVDDGQLTPNHSIDLPTNHVQRALAA